MRKVVRIAKVLTTILRLGNIRLIHIKMKVKLSENALIQDCDPFEELTNFEESVWERELKALNITIF